MSFSVDIFQVFCFNYQGCRHWEVGGTSLPLPFSGVKFIFPRKIGVDEKSNKKWHKKEGVQPKNWCPSYKFFYVLFSVTHSFLLGFSWSTDNIITSNKKNTSKSLINVSQIQSWPQRYRHSLVPPLTPITKLCFHSKTNIVFIKFHHCMTTQLQIGFYIIFSYNVV